MKFNNINYKSLTIHPEFDPMFGMTPINGSSVDVHSPDTDITCRIVEGSGNLHLKIDAREVLSSVQVALSKLNNGSTDAKVEGNGYSIYFTTEGK